LPDWGSWLSALIASAATNFGRVSPALISAFFLQIVHIRSSANPIALLRKFWKALARNRGTFPAQTLSAPRSGCWVPEATAIFRQRRSGITDNMLRVGGNYNFCGPVIAKY
jgi:hypothetical protein